MVTFFNLWQLILKGGPMMGPLLLLSIVALAVGLERIFFLSNAEKLCKLHKLSLMESLKKESIKQTLTLAESLSSSYSRIFKAGILKFGNSADVIATAIEEVLIYEIHRLKERISILSFVINVSVLMGLLGTVVGLTVVFHSIQVRSNVLNPLSAGDVALGIWQSLFSTILGLVVCIFSFSIYSFCVTRINNLIADLQFAKSELVHVLVQLAQMDDSSR